MERSSAYVKGFHIHFQVKKFKKVYEHHHSASVGGSRSVNGQAHVYTPLAKMGTDQDGPGAEHRQICADRAKSRSDGEYSRPQGKMRWKRAKTSEMEGGRVRTSFAPHEPIRRTKVMKLRFMYHHPRPPREWRKKHNGAKRETSAGQSRLRAPNNPQTNIPSAWHAKKQEK